MRNIVIQVSASLLMVWYSLSIIGFDVHTCNTSGETYIATIATGFSCEDLHPDHALHSHKCCCCHVDSDKAERFSESDSNLGMKSCCTGDFQVISLTGVPAGAEGNECACLSVDVAMPVFLSQSFSSDILSVSRANYGGPPPEVYLSRGLQASYGVWRI